MAHPTKNMNDKNYFQSKTSMAGANLNSNVNIYDPLFERYQREYARTIKEERLKSIPWRNDNAPSRSQSESKVVTNSSKANISVKNPKKALSLRLFGKKPNKNVPTSTRETQESKFIGESFDKIKEDPNKLVSGVYPPHIEALIVRKMKDVSSAKAKQGLWKESYSILKNILRCEKASLGDDHPQVANTLYHIGVAFNYLGDVDGALSSLQEGIHILFPKRYTDKNVDLAALFYQCGVVKGQNGNYSAALYHLHLAKQVEIHIFGNATEKTRKTIADYEYAKKASQRSNRARSRAA